jgi:GNAT superfamily N-acetyltransferase
MRLEKNIGDEQMKVAEKVGMKESRRTGQPAAVKVEEMTNPEIERLKDERVKKVYKTAEELLGHHSVYNILREKPTSLRKIIIVKDGAEKRVAGFIYEDPHVLARRKGLLPEVVKEAKKIQTDILRKERGESAQVPKSLTEFRDLKSEVPVLTGDLSGKIGEIAAIRVLKKIPKEEREKHMELDTVYVLPSYRGQGIGRKVVESLMKRPKLQKITASGTKQVYENVWKKTGAISKPFESQKVFDLLKGQGENITPEKEKEIKKMLEIQEVDFEWNKPKNVYWHGTSPGRAESIKESKHISLGTITKDKKWAESYAKANADFGGKTTLVKIKTSKDYGSGTDIGKTYKKPELDFEDVEILTSHTPLEEQAKAKGKSPKGVKEYVEHFTKLKEKIIKEKKGDCFGAACRTVTDFPEGINPVYVYGRVKPEQGPLQGKEFTHAWVEVGDVVFDTSSGKQKIMRKESYYEKGKIEEEKLVKIPQKEVVKLMVKTEKTGPYTPEQIKKVLKREPTNQEIEMAIPTEYETTNAVQDLKDQEPSQDKIEDMIEETPNDTSGRQPSFVAEAIESMKSEPEVSHSMETSAQDIIDEA